MFEHLVPKLLVVPAALIVAEVLPKIIDEGFKAAAITAGGLAAVGYLVKLGRRGHKRSRAFFARVALGLDILETTPERFERVEQRLDRHRKELIDHGKSLDVIADADKNRIKDALAGDERSPVDRRAA